MSKNQTPLRLTERGEAVKFALSIAFGVASVFGLTTFVAALGGAL